MTEIHRNLVAATVSAALILFAWAAPARAQAEKSVTQLPEGLEWVEIVPGVDFAAAYGAWSEEAHGKFLRIDPGVMTPFHTHTGPYHGVVIAGTLTNPYQGEEAPTEMGPGAYWYVPAGAPHATGCVSEEPCLAYTHADGLWDIALVEDPAGDRAVDR